MTGTVIVGYAANFTTDFPTGGVVPVGNTTAKLYKVQPGSASTAIPASALTSTSELHFSIMYTSQD